MALPVLKFQFSCRFPALAGVAPPRGEVEAEPGVLEAVLQELRSLSPPLSCCTSSFSRLYSRGGGAPTFQTRSLFKMHLD